MSYRTSHRRNRLDCGIRSRTWPLGIAVLFVLLSAPVLSQELEPIRDQYLTESRNLDVDLEQYVETRQREEEALRRLVELGRELDRAMADASVPATELTRLHDEIDDLRVEAFAVSQDAGRIREQMGDRMERMQALLEELRQGGVEFVEPDGAVVGTWLLESSDGLGLMSLKEQGGRLSGLYRLSNGRHGRLYGTFRGDRLNVELDDSDYGIVGKLTGRLGDDGRLRGEWSARELAAGEPTGGTWSGERLSFEDLLSL